MPAALPPKAWSQLADGSGEAATPFRSEAVVRDHVNNPLIVTRYKAPQKPNNVFIPKSYKNM